MGEGREAVGSGTDGRRVARVFEGKEGIGKVKEGLADARETCGGEEDVKIAIVVGGGGEIESASAVFGPRLAGEKATTSWLGGWVGWAAKSKNTR